MTRMKAAPPKAAELDYLGRFREVISDPLNLLIERVPWAGVVEGNDVFLHNGNRVPVRGEDAYYGDYSQLLIVNRGVQEPLEEFVFQEVLRRIHEAPRMIELGAYWGHYSMWLKKSRPQAQVIMVEPEGRHLAVGRNNFAKNGFVGEFIHDAVAPHRWKVDTFLQDRGLRHLDILHADIQGAEAAMIEGASDALAHMVIDYLFISTHSQEIHYGVIAELTRHNYRIEVSSDFDSETTSFDGLVVASSRRSQQIFSDFKRLGRTAIPVSRPTELLQVITQANRCST